MKLTCLCVHFAISNLTTRTPDKFGLDGNAIDNVHLCRQRETFEWICIENAVIRDPLEYDKANIFPFQLENP